MMNESRFFEWCEAHRITHLAKGEIQRIRNSPPSVEYNSGPRNVSGEFNRSLKMGHSIQFAGHTTGLQVIISYEFAQPDVIEYWDRPPILNLKFKDKKGVVRPHYDRPKFFIIREDQAGWEDWKTEEQLIKLAENSPGRYYKDDDGTWHFIPGEEYAAKYELYYRLYSFDEINYTLVRNLNILVSYWKEGYEPVVTDGTALILKARVKKSLRLTLAELLGFAQESQVPPVCVYELIAQHQLHCNLGVDLLRETDRTYIYATEKHAEFHKRLAAEEAKAEDLAGDFDIRPEQKCFIDGERAKIIIAGKTIVSVQHANGGTQELPRATFESYARKGLITGLPRIGSDPISDEASEYASEFGPHDLAEACNKLDIIKPLLEGRKINYEQLQISRRTIREWKKQYKQGERKYGNGLLGLLSRHKDKGSRGPRLKPEYRELMQLSIREDYMTPERRSVVNAYKQFCNRFREKGYPAEELPSLTTYRNEINTLKKGNASDVERGRRGAIAAYKYEEFNWWIGTKVPVHGDQPWQICHIDHTPLELKMRDPTTGEVKTGIYLTLMLDAFSRFVIAFHLSFDQPSRKSLMMILRECVRLYGRIPICIVADKGKEFRSIYFRMTLTKGGCDLKIRPTRKGRYGSVIERMFKTTHDDFIRVLRGNTQDPLNPRVKTKEVDPDERAVWTYFELWKHLDAYFKVYNNRSHDSLQNRSPDYVFTTQSAQYGLDHREIAYDKNFLNDTMVEVEGNTRKVVYNRGVKVNYMFYRGLGTNKYAGEELEVREEPYDSSYVIARPWNNGKPNGKWERLRAPSALIDELRNYTVEEKKILVEYIRRRKKIHAASFVLRHEDLALLHQSTRDAEETMLRKQMLAEADNVSEVPEPITEAPEPKPAGDLIPQTVIYSTTNRRSHGRRA